VKHTTDRALPSPNHGPAICEPAVTQTREWETAYRGTRRSLSTRRSRISLFELNTEESILDLGCGDGLDLHVFVELGYTRVYGLDTSLQLLAYAEDLEVIQADIYAMPIAGDSLDVVFVNGVLHHLADVEPAILEIRRVLSNGGVFCLIEPTSSPLRWLANKLTLSPFARFSRFLTLRKQMLEEELPCQEKWLATERLFPGLLEHLGFQIVFRRRSPFSVFIKARAT